MAGGKFSARKASIMNRGAESGGSVGGNSKAGLVSLWAFSRVPRKVMVNRLGGDCCSKRTVDESYAGTDSGANNGSSNPTDTTNNNNGQSIPVV